GSAVGRGNNGVERRLRVFPFGLRGGYFGGVFPVFSGGFGVRVAMTGGMKFDLSLAQPFSLIVAPIALGRRRPKIVDRENNQARQNQAERENLLFHPGRLVMADRIA